MRRDDDACSNGRGRPGARYVQVSTDEVYGDLEAAAARARTTRCARRARTAPPRRAATCRCSPTSAPTASTPRSPVAPTRTARTSTRRSSIPLFVTNALEGEPLPVYGDGKQVREWLHAEDHCAGIELVLREGAPGEIYNVGGEDHENLEVTLPDPRADRRRRVADPARRGSRRPRPALRGRRREAAVASAGRPRTRSARAGCRRPSTGIARTATGGSRSSPAPTARYYERAVRQPAQGLSRLTENTFLRVQHAAPDRSRHLARPRRRARRPRSRRPGSAPPPAPLSAPVYVLTGGGYGHGVGLSQYGALGQAKAGRTYRADPRRSTTRARSSARRRLAKVRVLVADGAKPSRIASAVPFAVRDATGRCDAPGRRADARAEAELAGRREAAAAAGAAHLLARHGRAADARRQGLPRRARSPSTAAAAGRRPRRARRLPARCRAGRDAEGLARARR